MNSAIDPGQWPLNTLLVSHRHRVMYMPIAKNANTTFKRLFVRLSGHPLCSQILNGDIHVNLVRYPTGLVLGDYTPEHAGAILHNAHYFQFVLLRNPLERAVSAYLDKFVRGPTRKVKVDRNTRVIRPAIEWVYGNRNEEPDIQRSISFSEFVDYLANSRDRVLDTHFKSQASYLVHQRVDLYGTIENLNSIVPELEERFGRKIEIEHLNRTTQNHPGDPREGQAHLLPFQLRGQRALPGANELLTEDLSSRLKRRYERDLKLWRSACA